MGERPRIAELHLGHYRSFENARLSLGDLTVLVGRNGAGKTTLMDALSFVREALTDSLSTALDRRDGLGGIRQRQYGRGAPYVVSLLVRLEVPDAEYFGGVGVLYGFRLATQRGGRGFAVRDEFLQASTQQGQRLSSYSYRRNQTGFKSDFPEVAPLLDPESLLLPLIAGSIPVWKSTLECLSRVHMYALSPDRIAAEPAVGRGAWLEMDGSNAGDVLHKLRTERARIQWIVEHLTAVAPGVKGVEARAAAGRRRLLFTQEAGGQRHVFPGSQMPAGVLRSLGILLAICQEPAPSLVLIDEIEDSVHPAALSVLLDAVLAATDRSQIVISSHSPEALGHPAVTGDRVRIVEWRDGRSLIFDLKPEVKESLKPPLTVGWLLRSNALWPSDEPATGFGLDAGT